MSPLYSLHTLRADIRQRINATDDHITKVALINQLSNLTARDNAARVTVSLSRQPKTPIKSQSLQQAGIVKPTRKDHWSFNTKNESAAKRMEKATVGYTTLFSTAPDLATVQTIATLGGWKKTLTKLSLDYFLDLPTDSTPDDREVFRTIFHRKLSQTQVG